MVVKSGDKIHVVTRRNFEADLRRHFIGEVEESTESAVKASGYVFIFDAAKNQFVRKPEVRVRVLSLVDAANIINVLPSEAQVAQATYMMSAENHLVVTDKGTFTLDINEFGTRC